MKKKLDWSTEASATSDPRIVTVLRVIQTRVLDKQDAHSRIDTELYDRPLVLGSDELRSPV